MPTNIFKFWSGIRLRKGAHPADTPIFSRVKHHFDLDCLPGCYAGPLRSAPVVLLYLSPGLSDPDYAHAQTRSGRRQWRRQLTGEASLRAPNDHYPAWWWWKKHTACFDRPWQELRSKVAILNIGAYHSKRFKDWYLLAALPSSRVSLDWAQRVLFPAAMKGDRIVVCLRAHKYWGLQDGQRYGRALFAPQTNAAGYMLHCPLRETVIRYVQRVI